MISNQIYNFFFYGAIMSLGLSGVRNKLKYTSPDYIKEKTLLFFNKLGKNELIKYPDFWNEYTDIWYINETDYELMNIINFILSFDEIMWTLSIDEKNKQMSKIFNRFEKYIGDIEKINTSDLSYAIHYNLLKFVKKNINFDDRYIKLLCLNNS